MKPSFLRIAALAAVVLLGLALRFGYGFVRMGCPRMVQNIGGDAEDYLQIAYTLSLTNRYERPGSVDVKRLLQSRPEALPDPSGGEPDAWRPPVWTWVLARLLRWGGYDLCTVFALRFLLDALTLSLFVLLAAPRLPFGLALLGTLLLALHPAWLLYSVTLLSEPLILTSHLLFTLAIVRLAEGGRSSVWVPAAGVLGGIAILTHGYMLAFPALLVAGLVLARHLSWRQGLAVLALTAATVAPWLVRNSLVYGTARPILSTSFGSNMAKGWNADFLRVFRNSADIHLDENVGADPAQLAGKDVAQQSAYFSGLAVRYIRSEWRLVPAILARKLVGAFTPIPEAYRPGILEAGRTLLQVLTFVPLLWVVFAGGRGPLPMAVRALALAYLVTSWICYPAIRYRFPLIWVEVLSLCLFLQAFGSRFLAWRRPTGYNEHGERR